MVHLLEVRCSITRILHAISTGLPRTVLQIAEGIFPATRESMNNTNSEKILVGPYGETYPACYDADQAMNIKGEDISDVEEEEDSVPRTIQEIKSEPKSYKKSEKILVGPYGETYPACYDADHSLTMKDEKDISDAKEEADLAPITIQEMKIEPEELQKVKSDICTRGTRNISQQNVLVYPVADN